MDKSKSYLEIRMNIYIPQNLIRIGLPGGGESKSATYGECESEAVALAAANGRLKVFSRSLVRQFDRTYPSARQIRIVGRLTK